MGVTIQTVSQQQRGRKTLKVVELFAGVGGFRVGLDRASKNATNVGFETVWASQWEPSTGKNQHAAWVYEHVFFRSNGICDDAVIRARFSNEDINKVVGDKTLIAQIPDHDVLTGGFPCQDYSVARPLNQAKGLEGKKGVLWWSIHKILQHKIQQKKPVPYLFLENVDRLLKSPASRRGRDFAIILSCLNKLGYVVEWRVINAGEYGFPQRRRRTFILAYHKTSPIFAQFKADGDQLKWVTKTGLLAAAFPAVFEKEPAGSFSVDKDPVEISKNFHPKNRIGHVDDESPFQNAGMMDGGRIFTQKAQPLFSGKPVTLGDVIRGTKNADERYFIPKSEEKKWRAQKEAHDFIRTSKSGHEYRYTEGALPFPDHLNRPSRTIITSEGGRSASRFKHVVEVNKEIEGKTYKYRRLTPEELESLCMFDRGHTRHMHVPSKNAVVEVPDTKRAFFMGNALVVGVIETIGRELARRHDGSTPATKQKGNKRVMEKIAA